MDRSLRNAISIRVSLALPDFGPRRLELLSRQPGLLLAPCKITEAPRQTSAGVRKAEIFLPRMLTLTAHLRAALSHPRCRITRQATAQPLIPDVYHPTGRKRKPAPSRRASFVVDVYDAGVLTPALAGRIIAQSRRYAKSERRRRAAA